MHGRSSRRLASIIGAALLTFGLLPGSGLLAASVALAAGTPTQLVFVAQPANAATGATITPSVTVHVEDSTGADVTTGTVAVTIAIGANPGLGTLSGTVTQNTAAGVATFSNLSINNAGIGYTLIATATALSSGTSSQFTILGPAAKLVFGVQPSNAATGATITPSVTVQVQDSGGSIVTGGSSVTLAFGTNAGPGTLGGTLTRSAASGTATFNDLSVNNAGVGYTLVATDGSLTAATSSAFTIYGPATQLVFGTQPSTTAAGAPISPVVTVLVKDSLGNTVTSSSASVSLVIQSNPASGTLSGVTTVNAVNGVATFSSLTINNAGNGYTLTASSSGLTSALSNAFNITGSIHLVFGIQPGGGAPGAVWTQQPMVEVLNSLNQVVNDSSTYVYLSIATNPAGGTLTCTNGTNMRVTNGYAYFSGCSINLASASAYTLSVTSSPVWTPATSSPFYIGGSAQQLVFVTQPGGGAAGAVWAQQPVVAVENASNAVVTTDNSTVVYLSIATNPAGGTLSCTGGTSEVAVNGYAYFSGCSINLASASSYTLSATSSPAWTPATSSAFYVSGARTTPTLTAASALGPSATSGFSTPTKILAVGKSITIRIQSNPQLAGTRLGVWIAIKGSNNVWGAYKPHTSVTTDATGTAYYTYTFGSKVWLAFRLYYGGSTTYAPAWSYPSQFGRAM